METVHRRYFRTPEGVQSRQKVLRTVFVMNCIFLRHAGRCLDPPRLSPYGIRLTIMATLLAVIPPAHCSSGDELSNNLFTDLSPLLALFGEQVTKQFLSDSMGWADHILFAMVPLGIITAVIGAIRCGGPRWLKAVVGRAKESRATVELELMSSTSADVCELWNGNNLVRVIGKPSIMELFYFDDSTPNCSRGVYSLKEVAQSTSFDEEAGIQLNNLRENDDDDGYHPLLGWELPPNISLNAHGNGISSGEMWFWASLGIIIQLGLLAFAGISSRYKGWGRSFYIGDSIGDSKKKLAPAWAIVLIYVGTLALMAGMMLCCYLIEKSSKEERWEFNNGIEPHTVWLQKGGTVGDQSFGSYAIFIRPSDRDNTWAEKIAKFFPYSPQPTFITSRRDLRIDNPPSSFATLVVVATFLALSGFIIQFVGMRNLHWSYPVAQLGCTLLMTAIRAWVRRSLFSEPKAEVIETGYELDFLSRAIGGHCEPWSAEWAPIKGGSGANDNGLQDGDREHQAIVDRVFRIRQRLSTLSPWESNCRDITLSLCKAIDGVMRALYETENIVLKTPDLSEFKWNVKIRTGTSQASGGLEAIIPLLIKRNRPIDNSLAPWGSWSVDQKALEALFSLLLENKLISSDHTTQTRASTSRALFFDSNNAWERQIFKWWIDHRNLQISGWLQPGETTESGSLSLTGPDLISSCGQEIFAGFFSEAVNQLIERIEGPTKLRLAGKNGLHAFGLGCDILGPLVEIVRDSGIGAEDEAFIAIFDPLAFHQKLPEPKLAIPDIFRQLQNSSLPKPDDAEEFLCYVLKAQIILYLRRKEPDWESAAQFLVEQIQPLKIGPGTALHTRLAFMLENLFRQSYVLRKSPEMLKLQEEACKYYSAGSLGLGSPPDSQLDENRCPYPLIETHEKDMLHQCLSRPPEKHLLEHLKAATDAGYNSVVDLILSIGSDHILEKADLEALETSFKTAAGGSDKVLINVFVTHLYILAATNSVRLKDINAEEIICGLADKDFDLARRLIWSSDVFLSLNLQMAAGAGCLHLVQAHLVNRADINASYNGRTALWVAVEGGHLEVVSLLLEKGADVNAPAGEYDGRTALQAAAGGGHLDMVNLLLEKGADVNAPAGEYDGQTALQAAAGGGHLDMVNLLLEKGADVNAPAGPYGRTALQAAAWDGHLDVMNRLRRAGARK